MARAGAAKLLLVLAGCAAAPPPAPVSLSASPAALRAGETLDLVLKNAGASEVGYNLCASALERRAGGGWAAVPSQRICTMELRMLAPGEAARYPYELPRELAPGEYRAVARVEGAGAPVRSGAFTVH